jgi:DNA-binding NtrC family response regulator
MPEMNGPALAKQLVSRSPGMNCLFMSGYSGEAIAHRGVITEDVNFIQKPFTIQDLAAAVRNVLDGGKKSSEKRGTNQNQGGMAFQSAGMPQGW